MKICQHKDISPAQHLKIPLLDAYTPKTKMHWRDDKNLMDFLNSF